MSPLGEDQSLKKAPPVTASPIVPSPVRVAELPCDHCGCADGENDCGDGGNGDWEGCRENCEDDSFDDYD